MHGDFSDITFARERNYSAVLDLQGRVRLDADRNEQTAILLHLLRTAMADLVGPHAGPDGDALGFEIDQASSNDFTIGQGRYYVDGILVENHRDTTYAGQPYALLDLAGKDELPSVRYLAYLKVWERHQTEVEEPELHEPALGLHHPDTTSRAQVVWQIRAVRADDAPGGVPAFVEEWIDAAHSMERTGILQVRARRGDDVDEDPCTAGPDAAYTGENQLYRVEVRSGGEAANGASFAWSRDNASVIYPIVTLDETVVGVRSLGRDWHTTLEVGHWVEVVDDRVSTRRELGFAEPAASLRQVVDIDVDALTVTLDADVPDGITADPDRHPYLRRWDHQPPEGAVDGAIPITEANGADPENGWIPIERGIEIRFLAGDPQPHRYRNGDYWAFPARRTIGDVLWRHPDGSPPHGVVYSYAPLAVVEGGIVTKTRTSFEVTFTNDV